MTTCSLCSTTSAAIYWTVVFVFGRVTKETVWCNACELEYRMRRKNR